MGSLRVAKVFLGELKPVSSLCSEPLQWRVPHSVLVKSSDS